MRVRRSKPDGGLRQLARRRGRRPPRLISLTRLGYHDEDIRRGGAQASRSRARSANSDDGSSASTRPARTAALRTLYGPHARACNASIGPNFSLRTIISRTHAAAQDQATAQGCWGMALISPISILASPTRIGPAPPSAARERRAVRSEDEKAPVTLMHTPAVSLQHLPASENRP